MRPDATTLKHTIVDLVYADDYLLCSCGEVMSASGGFAWKEHRNRVGLKTLTLGQTIGKRMAPLGSASPTASAWNQHRQLAPRLCGKVLRNRWGEWTCAVGMKPGETIHDGKHAGATNRRARCA